MFQSYKKLFIAEIYIILAFVLTYNVFIGGETVFIKSDGLGYYDYLPSIFIHHDINRKDKPIDKYETDYSRVISKGVYVSYGKYKVNKYPVGTAFLQLPFFLVSKYIISLSNNRYDGYEQIFQYSTHYASIFYLFLSLLFLRKLLLLYNVRKRLIVFLQVMMIFATPITIYANFDSSWSHIYSLFAITTFSYFLKRYFINTSKKDFFLACFFLGLIFILRQVNILVLLFVPFLAESYDVLKKRIINLFDNLGTLLIGLLLVFLICSFQFLVWYLQTGSIILYSYQNEGFNFMSPHFFDILFSYRKGLFVYTPALFIVTLSSLFLIFNKKVFVATSWFFAFIILTYILSSWWAWDYGCSYGSRPYIDYFVFFFLCLAIFIQKINNLSKYILFIIFSITIVLNIIQTYQYKHYILHWIEMDKTKYWDIFLKTEPRYRGILWKRNYNYTTFNKIKEVFLSDKHLTRNKITTLYEIDYSKIENSEKIKIIEVKFNNDFRTNNNSKFYVTIKDTIRNEILYYNENFLLSYREKKLNYYHTGLYNYEVSPITNKHAKLTVSIMPDNNFTIQNIIILFYTF